MAMDSAQVLHFSEIYEIHRRAQGLSDASRSSGELILARRRGIGGSSLTHVSETRAERAARSQLDLIDDPLGQDQLTSMHRFKKFCISVLPFLKGESASPSGVKSLPHRFVSIPYECCWVFLTSSSTEDKRMPLV